MQSSPETNELIAALCLASQEFKPIIKDKWNEHFSSHYADLASQRTATDAALAKYGLRLLQAPDAKGSIVTVTTRLAHTSGQWIEAAFSAEARNGTAQAVGAATTFICRNAEIHILRLALGEDDDGNSTQKNEPAPHSQENEPAAQGTQKNEPTPHSRDPIANSADIFDMATDQVEMAAELKSRNVPEVKWEAIGNWLHGKPRNQLSRAIASV